MSLTLTFDNTGARDFFPQPLATLADKLGEAQAKIEQGTGIGKEFLGWLEATTLCPPTQREKIQTWAQKIRSQNQVLIVLGIGGSYLGARAALEFCRGPNYNLLPKTTPEIYFAGNNLSPSATRELMTIIGERDFAVNVISKSGTTLEPALAFRFFWSQLEVKYGAKLNDHLVITTDAERGALRALARQQNYEALTVPESVGGRFSVLTAVGLLPLAVAGLDLDALFQGMTTARTALQGSDLSNLAWQYAGSRYLLERAGKSVELLSLYQPRLKMLGGWWQQLFGESEGKQGQGLYPDVVEFTTDLHSLGQYIQDGKRQLLETTLWLEREPEDLTVPNRDDNFDGLNYLSGTSWQEINAQARLGTSQAHVSGGVPNLLITIPEPSEQVLGQLFFFFEYACALSAYLLELNPFDQPGVEAYKNNLRALIHLRERAGGSTS